MWLVPFSAKSSCSFSTTTRKKTNKLYVSTRVITILASKYVKIWFLSEIKMNKTKGSMIFDLTRMIIREIEAIRGMLKKTYMRIHINLPVYIYLCSYIHEYIHIYVIYICKYKRDSTTTIMDSGYSETLLIA